VQEGRAGRSRKKKKTPTKGESGGVNLPGIRTADKKKRNLFLFLDALKEGPVTEVWGHRTGDTFWLSKVREVVPKDFLARQESSETISGFGE